MPVILASTIIDNAARQLFDIDNIKWSRSELLSYLNDGQRAIVSIVPEATGTTQNISLTAGTKQSIPTDGWMLLEATRNMGLDGNTPGRAVKLADRAILDETNPSWYSTATSTTQTIYMYNVRDRMNFYVYPPSPGTNKLEIIYSKIPADVTEATVISIADVYSPALLDYILFRAYSKNAEFVDQQKAPGHLQAFMAVLGRAAGSQSKLAQQMDQLMAPTLQTQGSFTGGNG